MKPGTKSTEFYIACVMVAIWAVKYLGLDAYITPENVNQVADAIKQSKAHGVDIASFAGVAYVIGRPLVKAFESRYGITPPSPNENREK